jgi:hypothetical protein
MSIASVYNNNGCCFYLQVGATVATKMRAVTSKSYAHFVETSFVEAYEEAVHDLYSTGHTQGGQEEHIPVVEDPQEGWDLQGANHRIADSAEEAKKHLDEGCKRHWTHETDIGDIQHHTASYFRVSVYQYWPATSVKSEGRVLHARMQFVCCPGAERMAMDPALLRIREGPVLNQSIVTFCGALQVCSLLCTGHDLRGRHPFASLCEMTA